MCEARAVRLAVFGGVMLTLLGCGAGAKQLGRQVTRKVLIEAAGHATNAVGEELLHQQRVRHERELQNVRAGQPFGPGWVQPCRGRGRWTTTGRYNSG